jgi:hypothetical protein
MSATLARDPDASAGGHAAQPPADSVELASLQASGA